MERLKIESSSEKTTKTEVIKIESSSEVLPPSIATTCLRKIKPRAIIFKANDNDFCKLIDSIESQFPNVEIVYVTTGPVASILRVTKSIPFEMQNSSEQPNYTIE
jgi:hypothetical protein